MDFAKLKNNKVVKIALIVALPTALVGAYFGYKYLQRKSKERKLKKFVAQMQEKYIQINSVNEFLEGIKYLKDKEQLGYNLDLLVEKKSELEKMPLEKLKRLYQLMQIPHQKKSAEEQEEFLSLMRYIYP